MVTMTDAAAADVDPLRDPEDSSYSRVPNYLWKYANDHSDLTDAAEDLRQLLIDLATEASIRYHSIEARAKKLASYRDKSLKTEDDGTPKYADPANEIRDCVAARAILFTTRARDDFATVLQSRAEVDEQQNPGARSHNGYDSEHFIVTSLRDTADRARYTSLVRYLGRYPGLEIQLRSVAAHAWAEYEHDVRYKSTAYDELSTDAKGQINQWFIEAGGMRRVMDDLFDKVQGLLYPSNDPSATAPDDEVEEDIATEVSDDPPSGQETRVLDTAALADVLQERYPGNELGDVHTVAELVEHLAAVPLTSVAELESSLGEVEAGHVARLMDYPTEPTAVRRLDDELLAVFTDHYVETALDEKRRQLLRLRLGRVRGKFAIYSLYDGRHSRRPVTAARAVRDLAGLVARFGGLDTATVPGAVSTTREDLNPSAKPRAIRTGGGTLYVATNFTRAGAEQVMGRLVLAASGSGFKILRAGDVICEAPQPIGPPDL